MKKFWDWFTDDDHWLTVVAVILAFSVIGGCVYAGIMSNYTNLTEGVVTDKYYFPSDKALTPGRYIIHVKNGDRQDTWLVTEKNYENVKVGDWVTK